MLLNTHPTHNHTTTQITKERHSYFKNYKTIMSIKEIELTQLTQKASTTSLPFHPMIKGNRYNHLQQGQEYLLKWKLAKDGQDYNGMSMVVLQCQFVKYFDNRQYSRFLEYPTHTHITYLPPHSRSLNNCQKTQHNLERVQRSFWQKDPGCCSRHS